MARISSFLGERDPKTDQKGILAISTPYLAVFCGLKAQNECAYTFSKQKYLNQHVLETIH